MVTSTQPGSQYGDMLYAEFTAVSDWNFTNITFHELFDVCKDVSCTFYVFSATLVLFVLFNVHSLSNS